MNISSLHETIAATADKFTKAGSAGTLVGWLTSSEFGMWAGIVIGIAGLMVNWYFKRKMDRRNQEAHDLWMSRLNATPSAAGPIVAQIPVEEVQ